MSDVLERLNDILAEDKITAMGGIVIGMDEIEEYAAEITRLRERVEELEAEVKSAYIEVDSLLQDVDALGRAKEGTDE